MNLRVKNGKKSGTRSIRIDQIYDVTMFTCQLGDYSNGASSLVTYQNGMKFCTLTAQCKLSSSCRENCCQYNTVGPRPLLFKTIMLQLFFFHKQKLTLCVLLPFAFVSRTSWWYNSLKIICEEVITEHSLKSFKGAWNLQCCYSNKISDRLNQVLPWLICVQSIIWFW